MTMEGTRKAQNQTPVDQFIDTGSYTAPRFALCRHNREVQEMYEQGSDDLLICGLMELPLMRLAETQVKDRRGKRKRLAFIRHT